MDNSTLSPEDKNFNSTVDWVWSPVHWDWTYIIQLLLALIGMAGNLLVMVVLFRPRRKRCSTDTLTAALAVADFLTSVFIVPLPTPIALPDTSAAHAYCRTIYSLLFMWISICSSIFTLTILSLQKFIAVKYPYAFQRVFSRARTVIYIVCCWLLGFIVNITIAVYFDQMDGQCRIYPNRTVGWITFVITFLIPVCTMITVHVITIRVLNFYQSCTSTGLHHTSGSTQPTPAEVRRARSRRKVVNMFFTVVITFVVCFTPIQICFLALSNGWLHVSFYYSTVDRCFTLLAFANSCANPFIYAARNANFRMAVREMFAMIPRPTLKPVFDQDSSTGDGGTPQTNMTPASSRQDLDSTGV